MKKQIKFDYASIWRIAYPILISMLMQQLVGITDVIYMGRLGETELGASALGSTYFFTIFMVSFGFSVGAQIIMARRNGEGEFAQIGKVFYTGCIFVLLFSLCVILLSDFLSSPLLKALIENSHTANVTMEYVNWRIWGMICASLMMMCRAFFVAVTTTRVLTVVSVVMVIANVFLNYIFIFGKCGIPGMGIAGAALASDFSEFIAMVCYFFYFVFKIDVHKYGFNRFSAKNLRLLKPVLSVSIWTMLQQFVSVSTWFLFFVAIEHLSERALAVSNLLRSLSAFPFVVVNAFAAAAGTVVSNLIGAGRDDEVLPACGKVIRICAVPMCVLLLFMVINLRLLLTIYTENTALITESLVPGMVMLSAFLPLIPGWVLFNAVSGTGNTGYAFKIEVVAMMAYVMHICVVILYLKLPLAVCWTADWVYNTVILVTAGSYMYSLKWRGRKV